MLFYLDLVDTVEKWIKNNISCFATILLLNLVQPRVAAEVRLGSGGGGGGVHLDAIWYDMSLWWFYVIKHQESHHGGGSERVTLFLLDEEGRKWCFRDFWLTFNNYLVVFMAISNLWNLRLLISISIFFNMYCTNFFQRHEVFVLYMPYSQQKISEKPINQH